MARPTKQGLDYFPLDVDFFDDDKIEYVSARFDEKGELITIKLLCAIYRDGYYTDWNEDKAMIFSKRAGRNTSPALANDVVGELVKRGFFDRSIFNSFGILTSRGIQKRFVKALADRKEVEIISEYWLIDLPQDSKRVTFLVIHKENGINHRENEEKHAVNPQSKVKESKVKERKENNVPTSGTKKFVRPTVDQVREYCSNRNNGIDAESFVDFYEAKGWRIGKDPMKDWKAAVRTWERRRADKQAQSWEDL